MSSQSTTDDASMYLDSSFRFDGTTSDLAQQLYRQYRKNVKAPGISPSVMPAAIQSRLDAANVKFSDLPGLLQRALAWDSGYAVDPSNNLVRIKTLDGVSMADIAIPMSIYTKQCTTQSCTQSDGSTWSKSSQCNGDQMNSMSLCVADTFTSDGNIHLSMWSTGGSDDQTPEIRITMHTWSGDGKTYKVPAIHTMTVDREPSYGMCGTTGGQKEKYGTGSLVVACALADQINSDKLSRMKPPKPSSLVTAWLKQFQTVGSGRSLDPSSSSASSASAPTTSSSPAVAPRISGTNSSTIISRPSPSGDSHVNSSGSSSGSKTLILIPIVVVVILVVAVLVWWFLLARKQKKESTALRSVDPSPLLPPGRTHRKNRLSASTEYETTTIDGGHLAELKGSKPATGTSSIASILVDDPRLCDKRIEYEQIHFDKLIDQGDGSEVWMGRLNHQAIALKRLQRNRPQSIEDIEMFAHEIQLSASLEHPNIVKFLGVAWTGLETLVMVMEYLPHGNLMDFLRTQGRHLTWEENKLPIARNIAGALAYMHSQVPTVVHCDVASKNVLMSDRWEPKLIDFGVKMYRTNGADAESQFGMAPEVLGGARCTAKSDVYSFGILLVELDTCQVPYCEGKDQLKPQEILRRVAQGTLRPRLGTDCPYRIQKIVESCLNQDPAKRPTARELCWMLA